RGQHLLYLGHHLAVSLEIVQHTERRQARWRLFDLRAHPIPMGGDEASGNRDTVRGKNIGAGAALVGGAVELDVKLGWRHHRADAAEAGVISGEGSEDGPAL